MAGGWCVEAVGSGFQWEDASRGCTAAPHETKRKSLHVGRSSEQSGSAGDRRPFLPYSRPGRRGIQVPSPVRGAELHSLGCRCRSQDGSTTLPPFMQMCIRRASPHGHVSRFVVLLGASHDIRRVLRLVLPRRRAEQNYLPWTLSTQQVKLQMLLRLTTETCRCVVGRDEYSTNDRLSVSLFTGLSMTKVGS